MKIANLLKTPQARIIMSIIWGLGLACIFKFSCKGRDCIVFKAPNPNLIKDKIYQYDNSCYKYDVSHTKCTKDAIESNH